MDQNEVSKQGGAPNRDFVGFPDLCDLDRPVNLTSENPNTQLTRLPVENIENTKRMTADPNKTFRDLTVIFKQSFENFENTKVPIIMTRGG